MGAHEMLRAVEADETGLSIDSPTHRLARVMAAAADAAQAAGAHAVEVTVRLDDLVVAMQVIGSASYVMEGVVKGGCIDTTPRAGREREALAWIRDVMRCAEAMQRFATNRPSRGVPDA